MTANLQFERIDPGKKLYFASDFHLGVPNKTKSLERERKIISWLDHVADDAAGIILVGDIFDFWFEYKHVIPKGFIRFQGKLAALVDRGIPVVFFTGNHDMWMFDYFTDELNIPIHRSPRVFQSNGKTLYVGHGDGLGPGDRRYKLIKKVFSSPFCQWLFKWLHPDLGISMADRWSRNSRKTGEQKNVQFKGDEEWLIQYLRQIQASKHHDYYIFGHRHLPCDQPVDDAHYINLGDWFKHQTYAAFDGSAIKLYKYEG